MLLDLERVSMVAELPPQYLRDWIRDGYVSPTHRGGIGTGNGHRFSLTQAVGIVVASQVRYSRRGCSPAYLKAVVDAFASLTEEGLVSLIQQRGRYFVHEHYGKPILQEEGGEDYGWPDVEQAYRKLKLRIR
jgi:hypothetical protein